MFKITNLLSIVCACILAVRHSDASAVRVIRNSQEFISYINNVNGCKATIALFTVKWLGETTLLTKHFSRSWTILFINILVFFFIRCGPCRQIK